MQTRNLRISTAAESGLSIGREREAEENRIELTREQIEFFNEQGYLSLEALTTPEEVAEIKAALEEMFARRVGEKEGAFLDLVAGADEPEEMSSPQIFNPSNYNAKLHKTRCYRNALHIAKQLLGEEVRFFFDLSILKQPMIGAGTPWHQDEAFRDANFEYRELSIWLPLQDVTAESGCLRYIPGSNTGGLKQHRSINDDPTSHAVYVSEPFDEKSAVTCPLPAGGCVLHQPRTIHGSTANESNAPRLAYIMAFGLPPKPLKEKREFTWAKEKHTAAQERNRQWMRRGGMFVMLWRKLRRGDLLNWKLAIYNAKRLMRSLGVLP
jgi:ectoine hydroxylase-related dioxygenase (phytanoyl-CoA dioxygenase family)